ncbi:oxygen-independent coproporphyrinogen-3 oxidase [Persephonella hydrogeniphila]|uniref:Heme chaperone HemW n=1 Tax=Persephonella hydrogeniphila TaxID=198703 RepID=A0A285NRA3_9AQUI|nr:radical SAM family heme chaperone HemW [Persephonella hydrogeniphila]SNZ10151.1 oxygen-independent coproporphyrinogen-3 oxidase [Persephonella hydrogeniphila]
MIEGVYIHIPFCNLKCPYCDFTSVAVNDRTLFGEYVKAVKKEVSLYRGEDFSVKSIYFGGGTPSLIEPEQIVSLINTILKEYRTENRVEITVEINPETYRYEQFRVLKEAGVNRISIGAQSFLEKNLRRLGRVHSPKDTVQTVEDALKAGFENISLDMIYGISGQSIKDLEKDLELFTSLPVKHISAYMLTAYDETPLGQMVKSGDYQMLGEDILLDMFKLIDEYLEMKGFKRYELSNWAKTDYMCRHNLLYWKRKEFLGLGVSAWSYVDNIRFGNTKNLSEYMEKVNKGKKPVVFKEVIDEEEEKKEKIFLGLRLVEGIELHLIENRMDFVNSIVNQNLAKIENNRLILTPEGIMLSNYISSRLI